ncbi:FadR/GntR family transcriptional regulator [Clostridium hydrogeniformans]|uniref:FadR/GntR family transcriptional regulator n=1 Tax=Clostridium hydrogeniformans TaxID=349933 RepID=UPI000484D429|nr:FadR/GntR family transcriptional regulator [Clostridium hydrogeniformans]
MFTSIKGEKVYKQVINQIKEMIIEGKLKKGDKLPSERDMAEQLGVSRASIREALIALEVVGLTESKQGSGNYIKETFDNTLIEPMSIMFILEDISIKSLYEFRRVLELEAVVISAKRIENSEIQVLEEVIDNLRNSNSEDEKSTLDKEFHYIIIKSTKNPLIINFFETISKLMDNFIKSSRGAILAAEETKDVLMSSHEKILESLKERNEENAYKEMKKHLDLIKNALHL